MRPHAGKTSIPSAGMRLRIAGVIAIALSIAIGGFPGATTAPAFAQSPKPATDSQAASAQPTVLVTAAPQPAAASSPASLNTSAAASPPDAQTVISYLSDVIKWYGHLGVEAQLVRDPDETLFFADDRQTAGEVLRLAFDYARKQAKFIARINPNAGAAAGSAGSSADAAGLGSITQTYETLAAAGDAIKRKPSLRLAPQGTANIESQLLTPATADSESENGTDQPADDTPDDAAAGEKPAGATPPHK
jgi:hypothetical protein